MARSVAHVGDSVALFAPPGFTVQVIAGVPSVGIITIPLPIAGVIQAGSSKFKPDGIGVAHIGDPVMCAMGPTLAMTGTATGAITPAPPNPVIMLSGTIEVGSKTVRSDGRGIACTGDSALFFFPPALLFTGTVAGQPYTGPIVILTPARGIIKSKSKLGLS